jgi:hypothetical protein
VVCSSALGTLMLAQPAVHKRTAQSTAPSPRASCFAKHCKVSSTVEAFEAVETGGFLLHARLPSPSMSRLPSVPTQTWMTCLWTVDHDGWQPHPVVVWAVYLEWRYVSGVGGIPHPRLGRRSADCRQVQPVAYYLSHRGACASTASRICSVLVDGMKRWESFWKT